MSEGAPPEGPEIQSNGSFPLKKIKFALIFPYILYECVLTLNKKIDYNAMNKIKTLKSIEI